MPYRLLRFLFAEEYPEPRMFRRPERLEKSYDAVIIGGGGHGLAAAYYLAKDHDFTNVAVLEKGYLGGGNTGRNTAIVRSNYLTPEGVAFYDQSVKLFQDLSADVNLNLFYSERGHFTLAHTDSTLRTMRWRAEVNKHLGVNSEVVDRAEIKRLCPHIDLDCGGDLPILGALYHPPGAVIRHDAVAWGYAKEADRRGIEIHQQTKVTGIELNGDRVHGVHTDKGFIETSKVLSAVAGYTPRITAMVGLRTPIVIQPLQACVTEPLKPWLDNIIVSANLHIYISQSSRGELVMGASLDPYEVAFAAIDFRLRRGIGSTHAGPVPVLVGGEGESPVGRHVGHDARLFPDHGQDTDRWVLPRHRLGHVGFQSHSHLRQDDGTNDRE